VGVPNPQPPENPATQTVIRTGPPLKKPVVTARLTPVTSSSTNTSRPVYQNVLLLLDFCECVFWGGGLWGAQQKCEQEHQLY
jgi:hypothetical protein